MLSEAAADELTPEGWLAELERLQAHLNVLDVYGAWLLGRAELAGAAAVMGERSIADALPKRLGISRSEANRRRRTADAARDSRIRDGMSRGDLNSEQAADLAGADVPEEKRSELIDEARAGSDDADTTRRKVKDAERQAAKDRGEDPTVRQRRRRTAKRFVDRDGMWNLQLCLDPETGAQIDAALSAESKRLWRDDKDKTGTASTADDNRSGSGSAGGRTPAQRLADAAANLLLNRADGEIARSDGSARASRSVKPDLVVTLDLDELRSGSGAAGAETNGGVGLDIETIRRHACDTNLIPAVLGSRGEVLDLGRTVRLVTRAQRRALAIRDGGCVWPGCDQPPANCDAHHVRRWADGGPTNLSNLALLCHIHHHRCHEGGYVLWARPPDPETGQRPPGWMIHDSGGLPRWPTRHRTAQGTQSTRGPTVDRGRAPAWNPDPDHVVTEFGDYRGSSDVTWAEPSLFADTG